MLKTLRGHPLTSSHSPGYLPHALWPYAPQDLCDGLLEPSNYADEQSHVPLAAFALSKCDTPGGRSEESTKVWLDIHHILITYSSKNHGK